MRKWRVGTFSMGMLLISIGVILLAGQISGISSAKLIFSWWPIILVILGIEVLAHVYFSKEEQPKVKYDGFSIFIIIFIIIASTVIYSIGYAINTIPGVKDLSAFGVYRNESRYTKNFTIKLEEQKMFSLKNYDGNIVIKQGEGDNIEIEADISITNNDETYAKNVADGIVEISKANGINLSTKFYNRSGTSDKIKAIRVNYLVRVPKGVEVSVKNEQGTVTVNEINKKVSIENDNGDITFGSSKEIENALNIESKSGTIRINIPKSQKAQYKAEVISCGRIIGNIFKKSGNEENIRSINEIVGNSEVIINLKAENGDINILGS